MLVYIGRYNICVIGTRDIHTYVYCTRARMCVSVCVFFLFKHFVVVFSLSDQRKADRRYYMYIIVGGYPRRAIRGGGGGGARERSRFPSLFFFLFVSCVSIFSLRPEQQILYLPKRLFFLFVSLSHSRTPDSWRSLLLAVTTAQTASFAGPRRSSLEQTRPSIGLAHTATTDHYYFTHE